MKTNKFLQALERQGWRITKKPSELLSGDVVYTCGRKNEGKLMKTKTKEAKLRLKETINQEEKA